MGARTFAITIALLFFFSFIVLTGTAVDQVTNDPGTESLVGADPYTPQYFIRNDGQEQDPSIAYYTHSTTPFAAFKPDSVMFLVSNEDTLYAYEANFIGANDVTPIAKEQGPTRFSYFHGATEDEWVTNVPCFERIAYEDLYDGIDLEYYITQEGLKYDFYVDPYVDPSVIQLQYRGVSELNINNDQLIIQTEVGTIIEAEPYCYHNEDHTEVASSYSLDGNVLGFDIPDRDLTQTLVIDPLVFSTYIGGVGSSDQDDAYDIDVDDKGNMYVCGYAQASDFPTTVGAVDTTFAGSNEAVLVKLNNSGSALDYATFLGGSGIDNAASVVVDDQGNAYITGRTDSSNFPTTAGAYDTTVSGLDIYVTKVNPLGTGLVFSTYLGGSDSDQASSINFDDNGDVYVTGYSMSNDFPTTAGAYDTTHNGNYDGIITKLSSTGASLIYSTYIGGTSFDSVNGGMLRPDGQMIIVGSTSSSNLPTTAGAYDTTHNGMGDLFVSCINATGQSLNFSTFFGGSQGESCYGGGNIAIGEYGSIFVCGRTMSFDIPTTPGCYDSTGGGMNQDCFLVRFKKDCSDLIYSTYYGGGGDDEAYGIAKDIHGNIYLGGFTTSSNLPTTPNTYDNTYNTNRDAFVAVFNSTGMKLINATYIGGTSGEETHATWSNGDGSLYLVGTTFSSNYPTTAGSYDQVLGGTSDWFVSKLSIDIQPSAPTNIQNDRGNQFINLTWEAPYFDGNMPITKYHVYQGLSADYLYRVATITNGDMFCNRTSLTNGQQYYFYIRAENTVGEGYHSAPLPLVPLDLPSEPTSITVSNYTQSINMTWLPPASMGGDTSVTYSVYIGDSIPTMAKQATGLTDLYYNYTSLTNGQMYYIGVTATNGLAEGPMCTPIPHVPMDLPTSPQSLGTSWGDGYINLSWSAPVDDGGVGISKYTIYRGTSEAALTTTIPNIQELYHNDTGLTNGIKYFYKVAAVNIKGTGNATDVINATPYAAPSVPLGLTLDAYDDHIIISWAPPAEDGGDDQITYKVYKGMSETTCLLVAQDLTELTYNDTGLTVGLRYHYAISAVNLGGESLWTVIANTTTWKLPCAAEDLAIEWGDSELNLSWDEPNDVGGGSSISYAIFRGTSEANTIKIAADHTDLWYLDTGLTNGVPYFYEIQIITEFGRGPMCAVVNSTPYGLPSEPLSFATTVSSGTVHLTWDLPLDNGGDPILIYKIYKGTTNTSMNTVIDNLNTNFYNDTGLTNGQVYFYKMTATNIAGESIFSVEINATPIGVPSIPRNFEVTPGDAKNTLEWDSPADDGGDPDITYTIFRGEDEGSIAWIEQDYEGTTYEDTGLTNNKEYYYAVVASNSAGDGLHTDVLAGTPIGIDQLKTTFTWTKYEGDDFVRYEIHVSYESDDYEPDASTLIAYEEDQNVTSYDVIFSPGQTPHPKVMIMTDSGYVDPGQGGGGGGGSDGGDKGFQLDWWEITGITIGIVVTLIAGAVTLLVAKAKLSKFSRIMDRIDTTYNENMNDKRKCRKELEDIRDDIQKMVKDGSLSESKFIILRDKINEYQKTLKPGEDEPEEGSVYGSEDARDPYAASGDLYASSDSPYGGGYTASETPAEQTGYDQSASSGYDQAPAEQVDPGSVVGEEYLGGTEQDQFTSESDLNQLPPASEEAYDFGVGSDSTYQEQPVDYSAPPETAQPEESVDFGLTPDHQDQQQERQVVKMKPVPKDDDGSTNYDGLFD